MSTVNPAAAVPALVGRLCDVVAQLENLFKGRKFTLDGHLVGSIGEALVADRYDLTLLPTCAKRHDARAKNGRLVQIKTTQRKAVGMSSRPRYLLVVKLNDNGNIDEIYNGPGALAWNEAGRRQKNGQRVIGVGKLRALMAAVGEKHRIALRS